MRPFGAGDPPPGAGLSCSAPSPGVPGLGPAGLRSLSRGQPNDAKNSPRATPAACAPDVNAARAPEPPFRRSPRTPRHRRRASSGRCPPGRRSPSPCAGATGRVRPRGGAAPRRAACGTRRRAHARERRPARRISARSNSASAPKMWNTSWPALDSVSIASLRLRRPTPCVRKDSACAMRSLSDRPSRSSRHTTSVSPARSWASASRRAGRSAVPPAVSSKMRSHPASSNACRCRSSLWSSVDTRA